MSYSSVVLGDNPGGYWPLNETSGRTATDQSGNGNNGTYSGTYTLGQTGLLAASTDTCVNFGGGRMAVGNATVPQLGAGNFSLEVAAAGEPEARCRAQARRLQRGEARAAARALRGRAG
jgi:hypothetical protein